MHVVYEPEVFGTQTVGGISRYFAQLVAEYRHDPALGVRASGYPLLTRNVHLADAVGAHRVTGVLARERVARTLGRAQLALTPWARDAVVHPTGYQRPLRELTRGRLSVVTVHDMIPELHPEYFTGGGVHGAKADHIRHADLVVCVSRATAADVEKLFPEAGPRLRVVPLGVRSDGVAPSAAAGGGTAGPTSRVLFVGKRDDYKNFRVLVDALGGLPDKPELVVVGGGGASSEETDALDAAGMGGRYRFGPASDSELGELYRTSTAFVFPSLHEGFGIPTLEAMAAGCPALLADRPVMHEVGGEAALYFDPLDAASLTHQLTQVLGDPTLRAALGRRGRERAARFSWRSTAEGTRDVYAEVLG